MAESLVVNNVTYPGVEAISMTNAAGEEVVFYPGEPNCKTYEITLAKSYGRVLLTTLDADVLAHINDTSLVVTLTNMSPCDNQHYTGYNFLVRNTAYGSYSSTPIYGMADRFQSSGKSAPFNIYAPANNTGTSSTSGAYATFHFLSGKYYVTPGDGYIGAGTYRLTFTW